MELPVPETLPRASEVLRVGGKEIRKGDAVRIIRPGGRIEDGWRLANYGSRLCVVEKNVSEGEAEKKEVFELEELLSWQTERAAEGKKLEGLGEEMPDAPAPGE